MEAAPKQIIHDIVIANLIQSMLMISPILFFVKDPAEQSMNYYLQIVNAKEFVRKPFANSLKEMEPFMEMQLLSKIYLKEIFI